MSSPNYTYKHERSVAFKDTDMAGIVHFTQLLAYAEEAEHAALLSIAVKPMSREGGFPKVHINCDYRSPARFGDRVEVILGIETISDSSLRWKFEIVDTTNREKKICEGSFVTVFVNSKGGAELIKQDTRAVLKTLLIT